MKLQNLIHILMGIVCMGFLPRVQAVVPPPDGGYPNFTTAEGTNALQSLTTGSANTAIGWSSLLTNAAGSFNTATGAGSLLFNTADANTAFGAAALLFNTTGTNNTAVGATALLNNTTGSNNVATGFQALVNNDTGDYNTANGFQALSSNTTGIANVATGPGTLFNNIDGGGNTGTGANFVLFNNTHGGGNTATGDFTLANNQTGNFNTADGWAALSNNIGGSANTALGWNAGQAVTSADDVICIGQDVAGENVSNTCYIGNIFGVTSASSTAVFVNSLGKLGTVVSARRFKDEIKPMDKASEAILALKPVTFRYKQEVDPARSPQFGLVAEDVEKVNPDLVVRDAEGKVNTVRYDAVNAMLLNEFLKEHKTVREQGATIAELKKQIEALTAGLQKVSAQLEVSKFATVRIRRGGPAPQVALNNP
jgi:trimeric autotransporter adhesin